ncbi:hypothetical protein [Oceanobacillus luteolus]|uniref:Uncharacterized protein n=1 Tax=Oceanobacillus luteolus TaxID=1274358 RepID=A0ABW4HSV4_9BACI
MELSKLVPGKRYVFIMLENSSKSQVTMKTNIGLFRGWHSHPNWVNFLLIDFKGDTEATPVYFSDIVTFYDFDMINSKQLKYAPMWECGNLYFHYSYKELLPNAELKYVVMETDYSIRRVQRANQFAIAVFNTGGDAEAFLLLYNEQYWKDVVNK